MQEGKINEQSVWETAIDAACELAKDFPAAVMLIRALRPEEVRIELLKARAADEAEFDRGIFQNIELGLMQDNGDGTFSLTGKGLAHARSLLKGTHP